MADLQVEGLAQALHRMVIAPNPKRRGPDRAVLAKLRTREAPAIKEMLAMTGSTGRIWSMLNRQRLKRLCSANAILSLLGDAVLPLLEVHPADAAVVKALIVYSGKLKTHALAVGGGFDRAIRLLHRDLTSYTNDASAEPPTSTEAELRARVAGFIDTVREIQDGEYTIAQNK